VALRTRYEICSFAGTSLEAGGRIWKTVDRIRRIASRIRKPADLLGGLRTVFESRRTSLIDGVLKIWAYNVNVKKVRAWWSKGVVDKQLL
jgi:hypothetical protein